MDSQTGNGVVVSVTGDGSTPQASNIDKQHVDRPKDEERCRQDNLAEKRLQVYTPMYVYKQTKRQGSRGETLTNDELK